MRATATSSLSMEHSKPVPRRQGRDSECGAPDPQKTRHAPIAAPLPFGRRRAPFVLARVAKTYRSQSGRLPAAFVAPSQLSSGAQELS